MRNRSKYRTWVSAALTAAAIMLTPTTALAASLSAMSLRITQSGSTIDVEKYASGSAYSVQSASVSDDTLTIKVYAGSGNSWSSKLTKAKVNLYGNLSSSDVESVSRSGSVLTVKVTLPDDAATSATSSKSSSSSSSGSSSKSTSSSKSSGSSSSTKSKVTVKKNALASSSSSSSSKKSSTSASGNSSDEDVNKTVLDPEDDAAYVILGGKWRMPTEAEWAELMKVYPKPYYHDEVTYDGVTYGDRNDSQKSIYLREGGYWSSTLNTNDPSTAMYVYMSYVQGMTTLPRSQPLPIRPVYED